MIADRYPTFASLLCFSALTACTSTAVVGESPDAALAATDLGGAIDVAAPRDIVASEATVVCRMNR
jgi:hypothetical protein